jgi:hypothetical protein
MEPEDRLRRLKDSRRKTFRELADAFVAPRPELTPRRSWPTPTEALSAKAQTVTDLRRQGHRVNGVGAVRRVYVIELDDEVGPKKGSSSLPWLYVGESSKSPMDRVEEHRNGARNQHGPLFSRVAHRHFGRARPDLHHDIAPVFSQAESRELERLTATRLRRAGYSVRSN